MSLYPFWSLNFELRPDLPSGTIEVLTAVARDVEPDPQLLQELPPLVGGYLSDWRQMLPEEADPHIGSCIRLFGSPIIGRRPGVACMSIEFGQHDDEYANGGWVFELWVLSLVRRPAPSAGGRGRTFIGYHAVYEQDSSTGQPIFVHEGGFDFGEGQLRLTFADLDKALADVARESAAHED